MDLATAPFPPYDAPTASMRVDPEAPRSLEVASESSTGHLPACAAGPGRALDWVPDVEASVVPDTMRLLCRACPVRGRCLASAVGTASEGYWAPTTTQDRRDLVASGDVSAGAADSLQDRRRAQGEEEVAADRARALHPRGQDSLWWYRRGGCRCAACRRHHADCRSRERQRAAIAAAALAS